MSEQTATKKPNKMEVSRRARSAARLNAVQALYQMEITGTPWQTIVSEFEAHRFGQEVEGYELAEADMKHFKRTLEGAVAQQALIDKTTNSTLKEAWPLKRIDPTLRALFRAAGSEFATMPNVPRNVVINEYVEVAKAFFDGDEPKFANAMLDSLARMLRPDAQPAS